MRCEKLSTVTSSVDNYILLMDFILEQPDSSIEKLDNCSVYIDGNSNIRTGSPENSTILKSHDTYVTPGLPGEEAGPAAIDVLQGCDTEIFDSCNFRDDASDKVVPCVPSSPNKNARVRDDVDHTPTAQQGPGICRPAIPAAKEPLIS